MYRGHEIRLEGGRYKTFSPIRAYETDRLLYTGSFNTATEARRWIREQERAHKEMQGGGA